jgi:hypothetical protein
MEAHFPFTVFFVPVPAPPPPPATPVSQSVAFCVAPHAHPVAA